MKLKMSCHCPERTKEIVYTPGQLNASLVEYFPHWPWIHSMLICIECGMHILVEQLDNETKDGETTNEH